MISLQLSRGPNKSRVLFCKIITLDAMNEVRNFKVGSPSTSCKKIMNFLGEKLWEGYKYPTYYHHIVDLKGERINRGMRVYVFFLKKKGGGDTRKCPDWNYFQSRNQFLDQWTGRTYRNFQMNHLSLRNNWFKFKTQEYRERTSNWWRKSKKTTTTCKWLDLETHRYWLIRT